MKLKPMKDPKKFAIYDLGFTDLKTVKDALEHYGEQGSTVAAKLAAELIKFMEDVAI